MAIIESVQGSTSKFLRVQPGVVLKYPLQIWRESNAYQILTDKIANNFSVERQILAELGDHPRIVRFVCQYPLDPASVNIMRRYFGWQDKPGFPQGLLLAEASDGSLQRYLDENNDALTPSVRKIWCRQVIESITYIHRRGVIHSDLRPENFLVHATTPTSLDLWLCDFGGSTCERLDLDGGHLPDSGFFDPNSEPVSTERTDIFSIASILYTILTGHWPYRGPGPFKSGEEMESYGQKVDNLFAQGKFPDVEGLFGGEIIIKCWLNQYTSADDILQALDLEIMKDASECLF